MEIGTHDQLLARALDAPPIAEVAKIVGESMAEVYLVGGTVRDLLLGREFVDVDLAVDGDTLELAAALGSAQPLSQSRFSTLRLDRSGTRFDIARTRRERYAHPGALPEVTPGPIGDDLLRRDFTANAIALGLNGARAGQLLAAPGALDDVAGYSLAVLHDRSFIDDPTRLLRLARYAARLGFTPSAHTRELAHQAIAGGALATISGTRVGNELRLLAAEPDPVTAFEQVAALGLPWSIDGELARRALQALPADGRPDLLVLALVLGSNEQLRAELDHLGFEAHNRDVIAGAAARSADLARRLAGARSGAEIARTAGSFGIETVALASSQGAPSQSQTWLQDLRHRRLEITGADLIAADIPEGPGLGLALQAATDALMNGEAIDRESQLRVALRAAE